MREIIASITSVTTKIKEDFITRLEKGNLLRSEDPISHFCVYFVPFIPETKKVFLGHHTKANAWIVPGGHIEPEHTSPVETVMQEAHEELGVELRPQQISKPFFLSVLDVFTPNRACRRHYSVWYLVTFDQEVSFTVEEREFYMTRWLSLPEAKEITNDENRAALTVLETIHIA